MLGCDRGSVSAVRRLPSISLRCAKTCTGSADDLQVTNMRSLSSEGLRDETTRPSSIWCDRSLLL